MEAVQVALRQVRSVRWHLLTTSEETFEVVSTLREALAKVNRK